MWTVTICFALRALNHHDTSLAQRIQHGFHTHQDREHLPLQCRGPFLCTLCLSMFTDCKPLHMCMRLIHRCEKCAVAL